MATQKWIRSTRGTAGLVSLLTTELNSLANAAAATSASAISNTTELDMYVDFELVFQHGSAPTADTTHDLYLVRSIDGTNYEDATAARPPAMGSVGSFVCDNTTSAQRKYISGILLPPGDFKVMLVNQSGQAMAASSNTLKAVVYNQQVV